MSKLSMTHEDRMAETLGDTVSAAEMADARRQAEEMHQDPVLADFYEQHADALRESEVESLNRLIQRLPRLSKAPLSENEQIARLVVVALKLGLFDAAELVKRFVDTDPNFSWDDIKEVM